MKIKFNLSSDKKQTMADFDYGVACLSINDRIYWKTTAGLISCTNGGTPVISTCKPEDVRVVYILGPFSLSW